MPLPYNAPSIPSFSHKTTASRRQCLRLGAYSQVLPQNFPPPPPNDEPPEPECASLPLRSLSFGRAVRVVLA